VIHALSAATETWHWMAGSSPAMTGGGCLHTHTPIFLNCIQI
jgi:hypothetical protein